jgi:hypothetical protein
MERANLWPVRPLDLTRTQILAHRRRAGMLSARRPYRRESLEGAAWAGLQDSMPRAALLSIHARVEGAGPLAWDDSALVQVWGPRFSVFVIARRDLAVFTLGRLSDDPAAIEKAYDIATRLDRALSGEQITVADAADRLGVDHNQLRYAAPTGTVCLRWEGAGQPLIWTVQAPEVDPIDARRELARRYLHVCGPTTADAFSKWAGIKPHRSQAIFEALEKSLIPVQTPTGEGLILSSDEESFLADPEPPPSARLLPSGDSYWLLYESDRNLVVPDEQHRAELWTPRVWPGALLVEGELVGTWRRAGHRMTVRTWRRLSAREMENVEAEATALPLPDLPSEIQVTWED